MHRFRLAALALALVPLAPVAGQTAFAPRLRFIAAPVDTVHPPLATRPVAARADALLPRSRIVAFYGNPLSRRMGILGELDPEPMLTRLDSVAGEWAAADSAHQVRPALHLIVTVAQEDSGADGMYRLRHGDALIRRVAGWAEARGWLLFLDIQPGRSPVLAEVERLGPWLQRPDVHLAIDPEFTMPADQVPGRRIGTLDATVVNAVIDRLAAMVERHGLPPKILVVHRFTEGMLTNHGAIRPDPRVQVVIHMDGFGPPALKQSIYRHIVEQRPVQFAGIKLFYKNDRPMLTPREVVALRPVPLYVQYQ